MGMAAALTVSAQRVTFYSSEFEEGVKAHLGLDDNSTVTQQQTDTITAINLSGFGIKDIQDVAYLPNVQKLDLSHNEIRDVAPLLPLDSLHYVDLRCNQLQDINLLASSCSDSLVISVAYNYITDFSRLFLPSSCRISISGMSAQKNKSASYMNVYQFYADIQDDQPVINYRGYSNMENGGVLKCGNMHVATELRGNFNTVKITDNLSSPTIATLSNGEESDTTWVVPLKNYETEPEQTVTMETGLPDSYTIGSAYAAHGTVTAEGTTMTYTAAGEDDDDTVQFTYYEGSRLRGISRFYIQPTLLMGDVNKDRQVSIADVMMTTSKVLGTTPTGFRQRAADLNGDGDITVSDIMDIVRIIVGK